MREGQLGAGNGQEHWRPLALWLALAQAQQRPRRRLWKLGPPGSQLQPALLPPLLLQQLLRLSPPSRSRPPHRPGPQR